MAVDPSLQAAASINKRFESLPALSSHCCIYRVPENLRRVKKEAYEPLMVSIGPFYHGSAHLHAMEEQKLRYLQSFLNRNRNYNLEYYTRVIRSWEDVARQCYVETIKLHSDKFIEMMLVDAGFIIELFYRACFHQVIDENDRIFNRPRMISEVLRDIKLEENQLPFFIIKGLYEFAFGQGQIFFVDMTYRFFMRSEHVPQRIKGTSDYKHFVDFLRTYHLPSKLRQQPKNEPIFEFPNSISALHEAGVKFQPSKNGQLLDINFANGVLEIPRITLTDDTESLFRNLMVFEQSHYYFDSYVIDYIALLDSLINSPKDVEILVRNGIIENWMGDEEEVSSMFNNIFKETRLRSANFYYSNVCRDLIAYSSTPWHKWKAILKHNYFNHPWAIISVIYAIVLLILTILQTTFGIIPIVKPK